MAIAPLPTLLKAGTLALSYALLIVLIRTGGNAAHLLSTVSLVLYVILLAPLIGLLLTPDLAIPGQNGRLYSVFPQIHAVPLGNLAAAGAMLALGGAGPALTRKTSVRALLVTAFVAVVFLTRTRAAVLLAAVGVVLWLALTGRARSAAIVVTAGLVFIVGLAVSPLGPRLTEQVTRGESLETLTTLSQRTPMWGAAVDVWSTRPLTGLGYYSGHRFGPYPQARADMVDFEVPLKSDASVTESLRGETVGFFQTTNVDSTWVETLLDLGILGVLTLGGFVIAGFWRPGNGNSIIGPPGAARLSALAVFLGYSIYDFSVQSTGYPMVFFGALLLLGDGVTRRVQASHGPRAADTAQHTDAP